MYKNELNIESYWIKEGKKFQIYTLLAVKWLVKKKKGGLAFKQHRYYLSKHLSVSCSKQTVTQSCKKKYQVGEQEWKHWDFKESFTYTVLATVLYNVARNVIEIKLINTIGLTLPKFISVHVYTTVYLLQYVPQLMWMEVQYH